MPTQLTCLRAFIASPSGLGEERKAFRDAIRDYNEAEAIPRGVLFQPVGWEDTLGGVGRPQSIINEDVRSSDFFVLLLWNRWGSPPDSTASRFSSGTEEEYHVALECYRAEERPMRQIVMMFKAVDPQQLNDPGPQLDQVLNFKKQIEREKTHLYHTFDTTENFQSLLRRHLAEWLRKQENSRDEGGGKKREKISPVSGEHVADLSRRGPEAKVLEELQLSSLVSAWALANKGQLTEAEVEFARAVVGSQSAQALTLWTYPGLVDGLGLGPACCR